MSKKLKFIEFRHLDGSQKFIPGVKNGDDLSPKMVRDTTVMNGKEVSVYKVDAGHIVRIALHDENIDVRLTPNEEKLPERVQDRILDRRAQEADFAIQANRVIRNALEAYANLGDLEILGEIEVDEAKAKKLDGAIVTSLSEIALADFADRGIEIPAHLSPKSSTPEVKASGETRIYKKK